MKKDKSALVEELFGILSDEKVHSSFDLSEELNCSISRVRNLVRTCRQRFNNGDGDSWIYVTKNGYTISDKPEHVSYEARLRLAMGFGILINGAFVLKQMKRIAQKDFGNLMIEYRPRMIEMGKIVK